jgi:hypothetical protein
MPFVRTAVVAEEVEADWLLSAGLPLASSANRGYGGVHHTTIAALVEDLG